MVEVFSTDVKSLEQANFLLFELEKIFPTYQINFDLEDCDKILRVATDSNDIDVLQIVQLMGKFGSNATLLVDIMDCKEK